ncbi:MAG TPA: hypothetical protein VFL61_05445 [Gaiellaceae bacterium]|nr:hypothetical protein [Gaiellaceae bacterium]
MNERPDLKQALGRLLGPSGPEIGCEECFERLDEYVELELTGGNAEARLPGFKAHLDGCPACREDYESLRALVGGNQAL